MIKSLHCNCERSMCSHFEQAKSFRLGARAQFQAWRSRSVCQYVGTVCDVCAVRCMRDYIVEMLGRCMIEHDECVNVEVMGSNEILAKFYGPDRYSLARYMLRYVG